MVKVVAELMLEQGMPEDVGSLLLHRGGVAGQEAVKRSDLVFIHEDAVELVNVGNPKEQKARF